MNSTGQTGIAIDDLLYGLGNILFSSCGISLYAIVLKLLLVSPDYKSSFAYQFMFHLGLTDIIQLVVHFITGFFVITQSNFSPLFSQISGAFMCAWYPMLYFSGSLTTNRFVQILFPRYYPDIFNVKMMLPYQVLGWVIFVVFYAACVTPFISYEFAPAAFSWKYSGEWTEVFDSISRNAEFTVVFGSAAMYCVILGYIWMNSVNKPTGNASSFERRITIQVLVICTFHIVLVLFWEFGLQMLPNEKFIWYISSFVWIIWCSFNPIIYLTFNRELRKRFLIALRLEKKPGESNAGATQSVATNRTIIVKSRVKNNAS